MRLFSVCALVLTMIPEFALATSGELQKFKAQYPNAKKLQTCKLCHDGVPKLNYYGHEYEKGGRNFKAIEGLDSDGDGFTNIQEIQAQTLPGDKASHP